MTTTMIGRTSAVADAKNGGEPQVQLATKARVAMKILRVFVAIILLVGASLSSRAAYLHVKADLASLLIHRAWDARALRGEVRPPWPWADTHPIARLQIPRLAYDEIVLEDANSRTLAFGPGRLLSSAAPGESGNIVLAGHRTSWFKPLEGIKLGDTVELQWFDARTHRLIQRSYSVQEINVVSPEDVGLLTPTLDDALTLITCYPFNYSAHSPQRYVIRATPDAKATAANM
jgi:sortase A